MKPLSILLSSLALATTASAMTFVHPGALNSQAELDFVKAKIAAKAEPWNGFFNQVKPLATARFAPAATINSTNNIEANASKADARRAYANALAWAYTGTETYAKQAIGILNAWSILTDFTGGTDQDKLQAGWIGALFGPAAEIMRGYPGWAPADLAKVQEMFRTAFYPYLSPASTWNGNVDLTQIDAMMSIAVFNEDEALFKEGLWRLKERDSAYFFLSTDRARARVYGGSSDLNWVDAQGKAPTKWVDGLTQETCRDNDHHAQYAMASAFHAAEVAWHQGVDVYTPNTLRYTAVLELMATQIETGSMQGTCVNDETTSDVYDTWEVGYNHYHNRMGLALPNTAKVIENQIRPNGQSDWNIFYETLTHADLVIPSSIGDRATGRISSTWASVRDGICQLRTATSGTADILVVSLEGKVMNRLSGGQNLSVSLGLEKAPSGVYLVRIASGEGNLVLKASR